LGNKTPLETWLERVDRIIRLDPTINLDDVFLHEAKRKVTKDNAFTLNGTYFEVPVPLPGQTIRLLYDPHLPEPVPRVFFEGKYQGDARIVDSYANSKVKRNKVTNSAVQDTGVMNTGSKFNFNIKAGLSAAKTK
jgi:putative transposase